MSDIRFDRRQFEANLAHVLFGEPVPTSPEHARREGRMPRTRTMPALLALLALAATSAARDARAADCLAGPNAQAPAGSHWYYRLDRATARKCWSIGTERARPRRAGAKRRSARPSTDDVTADPPAAPAPASAAHPPSLAARATAGLRSAEAQSAKAEVVPQPGPAAQPA